MQRGTHTHRVELKEKERESFSFPRPLASLSSFPLFFSFSSERDLSRPLSSRTLFPNLSPLVPPRECLLPCQSGGEIRQRVAKNACHTSGTLKPLGESPRLAEEGKEKTRRKGGIVEWRGGHFLKEERKERGRRGGRNGNPFRLSANASPIGKKGEVFHSALKLRLGSKETKEAVHPRCTVCIGTVGRERGGGNIAKKREGQLIGKISAVIFLALPLSVLFFPLPVAASTEKVVAQEEDVNLSRELQVAVEEGGERDDKQIERKTKAPPLLWPFSFMPQGFGQEGQEIRKKRREAVSILLSLFVLSLGGLETRDSHGELLAKKAPCSPFAPLVLSFYSPSFLWRRRSS